MKWIKKILRIIAIILPCLCCLAIPRNTFAKSFNVNTFPIAVPSKALLTPFNLQFSNTTYTAPNNFYYISQLLNNHCVYDETYNSLHSSPTSLSYSLTYQFPGQSPTAPCRQLAPIEDEYYFEASLPLYVIGNPNFRSWNKYWYQYDALYFEDSDTEDGLNRQSRLNFYDLFSGHMPDTFTNLTLPLGLLEPEEDTLTYGSSIVIRGLYDLGAVSTDDIDPNWSGEHYIEIRGFTSSAYYESNQPDVINIPCNLSTAWNQETWVATREFYCSGTIDVNFDTNYPIGFTFRSRSGSDTQYLWSMPSDFLVFNHVYIITNNDETPGGNLNPPVSGGETILSPGNIKNPNYSGNTETDWFSSLLNQFQFSLTNPFAPIYALFTDGESCARIPIIAGMLHAEDDQYCPWFDATTRNIVTPVVALSSVMLVFGFIIRWLGSDSGNFVEDRMGSKFGSGNTYIKGKD